jgi:RNA polymerase sigma-70 factor (ECF subfamily)
MLLETPVDARARSLPDAALVARVRAGEPELFAVLMRRHNQRLYRAARSILRDEAEAEDVMQQAYVNAYRSLDQFAERASFATWLTRIAVHEALARLRRRQRFTGVDAMDEMEPESLHRGTEADPERLAQAAELRRLLEAAIDTLPTSYRCVFVLREVEGMSTFETAECLSVSADVVKTRLVRARALLRKELYTRTGHATAGAFTFYRPRCDRVVAAVCARLGVAGA